MYILLTTCAISLKSSKTIWSIYILGANPMILYLHIRFPSHADNAHIVLCKRCVRGCPDGDTCFYGKCLYCKNESDGVCGEGDVLDGALVLMLPKAYKFTRHRHPWSRTYVDDKPAR